MKSRKPKKRKKGLRLIHMVLVFMFIYVVVIFNHQRLLMKDLNYKKAMKQEEMDLLQQQIDELNEEIQKSGTLEFIEKVAREELGMVKPREIIYIDKNREKSSSFDIFSKDK